MVDIEIIATLAVKESLSICDRLSCSINEKDKEPSWDGCIYIHTDENRSKKSLKKVDSQVKGKLWDGVFKNKITYKVDIKDMENYLYNRGVIYFVVCINRHDGNKKQIYYSILTPVKIKNLLKETTEKQKTKNIEFQKFPDDNNEKMMILFNCYKDCFKQGSFAGDKLSTVKELSDLGCLKSVSLEIDLPCSDSNAVCSYIFKNELYPYAELKGIGVKVPLEQTLKASFIEKFMSIPVTVAGNIFYDNYRVKTLEYKDIIYLGQSITIELLPKTQKYKLNFNPKGNLKERLHDMKFFISCYENQGFSIANHNINLKENKISNVKNIHKAYEFYNNLKNVLNLLGVSEELDVDSMNYKDEITSAKLITAFIDKKPLKGLINSLDPVVLIDLANLKIILATKPAEEEKSYFLLDFFKTHFDLVCIDENDKVAPVSQYKILSRDNFVNLSNINYDAIIFDIKKAGNYIMANWSLLEMISAYDISPTPILYEAIYELALWFRSGGVDQELPYEIRLLNYLQVVKRKRSLKHEEIESLRNLVENKNQRKDVLVGAYLLLGDQNTAEDYFLNIEPDIQKEFKTYPIYKFWNGN